MKQIAPNLWQLSGFPPNVINTYLIGNPEGFVLIDAGTKFMKSRIVRNLAAFLNKPEHSERKLIAHALTHVHPDHQGSSKAVCERFGVPLLCGENDAATMEKDLATLSENQGFLGFLARVWAGAPHKVSNRLKEGDTVCGFSVLETPGHTAGHIAFWREQDGVLILGDVLNGMNLMTGLPGLNEPPKAFTANTAQNRQSIRKIAALKPRVICFGHGAVLKNSGELERFLARLL